LGLDGGVGIDTALAKKKKIKIGEGEKKKGEKNCQKPNLLKIARDLKTKYRCLLGGGSPKKLTTIGYGRKRKKIRTGRDGRQSQTNCGKTKE